MLIFFFGMKGSGHREFVPPSTTINSDFYCDALRFLRENVRRKRLELWGNHIWLYHDNMPAQITLKTTGFVTNNNMVIVPHPPFSPHLVPCDFLLFSKLKMKLKQRHFETVPHVQRESQAVLDNIKDSDFHGALKREKNGSLYTFPRRLFRRRWQTRLSKSDLVGELPNKLHTLLYLTIKTVQTTP
jgi:hypothetical protein